MSGYSFGPTARRLQPRRPIGGFQPSSGGYNFGRPRTNRFNPRVTPLETLDFTSETSAQDIAINRIRRDPNLPDWARSELENQTIHGIKSKYDRPLSVLGGIARVLGVGENVAVGLLDSIYNDVRNVGDDPLSPWAWVTS